MAGIHKQVYLGNLEQVRRLLTLGGAKAVESRDEFQQTPLHIACYEGKFRLVKALVHAKADVHALDKNSWTPLHCAACGGHVRVVKYLLKHGADPRCKTSSQSTALHYLARAPVEQLEGGKKSKAIAAVQRVIAHGQGVDVNAKNKYGVTPLHEACTRGSVAMVEALVAAGADLGAQSRVGETPAKAAARAGRKDIYNLLVKRGSSTVDAKTLSSFEEDQKLMPESSSPRPDHADKSEHALRTRGVSKSEKHMIEEREAARRAKVWTVVTPSPGTLDLTRSQISSPEPSESEGSTAFRIGSPRRASGGGTASKSKFQIGSAIGAEKERMRSASVMQIDVSANTLNMSHQDLEAFPNELDSAGVLKRLNLSHNLIRSIDAAVLHELSRVSLSRLALLQLSWNRLPSIPGEISLLKNLRKLYLDNNHLTELPDGIYELTALETLDVSQNQLSAISRNIVQLSKLQKLRLSHNNLVTLPFELGSLISLQELWLNDNPLESNLAELYVLGSDRLLSHFRIQNASRRYTNLSNKSAQLNELDDSDDELADIFGGDGGATSGLGLDGRAAGVEGKMPEMVRRMSYTTDDLDRIARTAGLSPPQPSGSRRSRSGTVEDRMSPSHKTLTANIEKFKQVSGFSTVRERRRSRSIVGATSIQTMSKRATIRIRIDDVLDHPDAYLLFSEFVAKEYASENLNYWTAVNQYRILPDAGRWIAGFRIYQRFLCHNAPEMINITGKLRDPLLQVFQKFTSEDQMTSLEEPAPDSELFTPTQVAIKGMLAIDNFKRFSRTAAYKNLLPTLRKLKEEKLKSKEESSCDQEE